MSVIKDLFNNIPPENIQFVNKSKAIAEEIFLALRENAEIKNQKELAEKLGKSPSEISKLLSGMHNPTLRSITNLEVLLGTDLIITPSKAKKKFLGKEYVYFTVHKNAEDKKYNSFKKAVGNNIGSPLTEKGTKEVA